MGVSFVEGATERGYKEVRATTVIFASIEVT
jgi:hypothetical protein